MFSNLPTAYQIGIMLPGIIIGLTFHEFAHGWVANRLGDTTAKEMGRLTINPVAHLDPIGFVLLFIVGFGWAKPVPVAPHKMRGNMRRNMMLVSLAGPGMNLLIAIVVSFLLGAISLFNSLSLLQIMQQIISINVVLAVFNLLPVPPLDGSKILAGILPGEQRWLQYMEQYGTIILLLLLFSGVLSPVLNKIITPILNLMNLFIQISAKIF